MTYQKSEWYFFRQRCIDGKSGVKVPKRHLVTELKLKMSLFAYLTLSISALPPDGIFQLWLHFSHLWTLGQKSVIQIFDTSWLDKNIGQNVKNQCFTASCISGTLKFIWLSPQNSKRKWFKPIPFDIYRYEDNLTHGARFPCFIEKGNTYLLLFMLLQSTFVFY